MPTTPGIRKRSPIQLLTRPDAVWLRGSDENRYIQHGMVVGDEEQKKSPYIFEKTATGLGGQGGGAT